MEAAGNYGALTEVLRSGLPVLTVRPKRVEARRNSRNHNQVFLLSPWSVLWARITQYTIKKRHQREHRGPAAQGAMLYGGKYTHFRGRCVCGIAPDFVGTFGTHGGFTKVSRHEESDCISSLWSYTSCVRRRVLGLADYRMERIQSYEFCLTAIPRLARQQGVTLTLRQASGSQHVGSFRLLF